MYVYQLTVLLCVVIYPISAKITLRLRLASGAVSRVEADETEDIAAFRERLQSTGMIPKGSSLAIGDKTFQDGSPGERSPWRPGSQQWGDRNSVRG